MLSGYFFATGNFEKFTVGTRDRLLGGRCRGGGVRERAVARRYRWSGCRGPRQR